MKRILSIFMSVVLAICAFSVTAFAKTESKPATSGYLLHKNGTSNFHNMNGIKWVYKTSKKAISVTYIDYDEAEKYATAEEIPHKYKELVFQGENFPAETSKNFYDYQKLDVKKICFGKGVDIKLMPGISRNTLKQIVLRGPQNNYESASYQFNGDFSEYKKLNKINLSVATEIGAEAFLNTTSLTKVSLKNTERIGERAFMGTGIKKITVPNNVKFMYQRVFSNCKDLTYAKIGSGVKELYGTFSNCSKLEKVVLGKNIEKVANVDACPVAWRSYELSITAFQNCKSLKKIVLNHTKKAPKFTKNTFKGTKSGIKFYAKNKTVAKKLKTTLNGSGVKKAKIYYKTKSGKYKLVYKNVK